jgi:predicted  nucleic acid-binding Zn-ribbon protein
VAANISRRGATVLTKDELKFEIASEERFITKQRDKMDRMRSQNSGFRSGSISTDLAMFEISISNAEDRIAEHEKKIKELENES